MKKYLKMEYGIAVFIGLMLATTMIGGQIIAKTYELKSKVIG